MRRPRYGRQKSSKGAIGDPTTHPYSSGGFYPFGKIRGAFRVLIGEGMATVAAGNPR
jgi:hypothetical protein